MKNFRAQLRSGKAKGAFSLIELLVVMAIIGVLAAIGLPALRGLSGSNDIAAANRQLLDDLSYARFKAINERTTVYVVFMSHDILSGTWNNKQKAEVAKLANLQYTSYALFAKRSLGDQPGQGSPRYITEWRTLPEGVFIFTNKFDIQAAAAPDASRALMPLAKRPFSYVDIPFPTATDKPVKLPVLAFDYQGRLVAFDTQNRVRQAEDFVLPIVKGSIIYPQESRDPSKRNTLDPAEVIETPKNNYTNNPVIRVDWLTGRARSVRPENFDYASVR
jgi:prepilin-type N-terminal cleavage/methylation domain-containing protein